VSIPDVSDWQQTSPEGKWSQFFGALARNAPVNGIVTPRLSRAETAINLALSMRPHRDRWVAASGFNPRAVALRDRHVRRGLLRERGNFDVIVQLQTLCSPASTAVDVPYAIYTDNTMALTQRHRPAWAPLSSRAAASWERFEARLCREAHTVFTFSEFARRSMLEDYGCRPDAVLAVGAGANQWLDSPAAASGPPVALFVGEDFARKGGQVLLAAWTHVRRALPEAELLIVGPHSDPVAHREGVRWLGRVDRARLADLYRSAHVFVLPSLFEPWGHVFIEAMGYGLPCIAADCCAMPEMVIDGLTGRLVAPGQVGPLATALVDLLGDPGTARAMGAAGHRRVISTFTWDKVAERVVARLSASAP
jgi:starch synthase